MEVIHNVIRMSGIKKLNAAYDVEGEFRTKLKTLVLNGCWASCFVGGLTLISACSQLPSDTRLSEHQSVLLDSVRQDNSTQIATTVDKTTSTSTQIVSPNTQAILNGTAEYWHADFNHHQQQFSDVLIALQPMLIDSTLTPETFQSLDHGLYYLRAYSYWGATKEIEETQWLLLHESLLKLAELLSVTNISEKVLAQQANVSTLSTSQYARLKEHLWVALYRYYPNKHAKTILPERLAMFSEFVNTSIKAVSKGAAIAEQNASSDAQVTAQVNVQSSDQNDLSVAYEQLELYRAIGFLAYFAERDENIAKLFNSESGIALSLLKNISTFDADSWHLAHTLWGLANIHIAVEEEQKKALDTLTEQQLFSSGKADTGLDNIGNTSSSNNARKERWNEYSEDDAKRLFTLYLANSLRTRDHCDESFADKCDIKPIDEVLPVNHACSDSLFIRATQMTTEQLNSSCQKLLGQESFFHSTLATNVEPVPNDFNEKLRVVIFDNYSEYNRHGQLKFNIFTNNGGMYIEGTPSADVNQATFYAFEHFWDQSKFGVWNLNHEYVHYLDGRFVKYGGFGHYPEKLVWWAEGLAEYISRQDDNDDAVKLASRTKAEEWPSLADIFATTYEDGTDRVYRWSYLAQRFIFSFYPEQGRTMSKYLKRDYFDGYVKVLDDVAKQHQAEFTEWLKNEVKSYERDIAAKYDAKNAPKKASPKQDADKKSPSYLYRYLYRDYLRPSHLPIDKSHQHFEYWG
ncbi:MAG: collagenase [Thalassotalea sp.]|nr:collagenase [Thalassotalea sp.]